MSQPNPYAPPSGEPSSPQMGVPDGSLWRVEDGRLLVRDFASLPDVCIYGSPPEEPGRRRSVPIRAPRAWLVPILVLLTLAAVVSAPRNSALLTIFAAAAVLGISTKRVRVIVFEGTHLFRRRWGRSGIGILVIICLVSVAGDSARLPQVMRENLIPWASFWLIGAAYIYRLRAVRAGSDWYEIKGISPPAIARFAEIQQKTRIPQEDIRDRMKR